MKNILNYKKRKENFMYEGELFELFRKYARHEFGSYYIQFNSELLSANTPFKLMTKLKKAIKNVQRSK